jgi:flavin reductase (DIM6/NTAB) family NADH-FMN oxidoreductase RutF
MPIAMQGAVDGETFRNLFRGHAGGVVVITLDDGTGPAGFTATSLISLSLQPPMVSFAVSRHSSCWPRLRTARSVVVNFLTHDQDDLARTFAAPGIDRFAAPLAWRRLGTGEPVLSQARRWLRGNVRRRIPVGDHDLIVAEITDVYVDSVGDRGPSRSALVYHNGDYHSVGLG